MCGLDIENNAKHHHTPSSMCNAKVNCMADHSTRLKNFEGFCKRNEPLQFLQCIITYSKCSWPMLALSELDWKKRCCGPFKGDSGRGEAGCCSMLCWELEQLVQLVGNMIFVTNSGAPGSRKYEDATKSTMLHAAHACKAKAQCLKPFVSFCRFAQSAGDLQEAILHVHSASTRLEQMLHEVKLNVGFSAFSILLAFPSC